MPLVLLLGGAFLGYVVLMWTNPVRASLRDGFRAVRRYPALWLVPGVFGFSFALVQLAQRAYFASVLPAGAQPVFRWARGAGVGQAQGPAGAGQPLWWLPPAEARAALREAWLPALESLAGLFNCLVTTFPLSAVAALLLLVNSGGHHGVLLGALRKRFGALGWLAHAGILLCALSAIAKPFLYLSARHVPGMLWLQWSPVVAWLSFLFEYLLGVFVQVYLILLAYAWVRGLTFSHSHLVDFAIRRCSFVVRWAAVIMLLSTVLIDAPLILKNFSPSSSWFPEKEIFASRLALARAALAGVVLLGFSMQITLTFHSESFRGALRDHRRFVSRHWWPMGWFTALAALHLSSLQVGHLCVVSGLGEGTALWVAWTLLFPWCAALVSGWLLASWVCVYKRCEEQPGAAAPDWFRF